MRFWLGCLLVLLMGCEMEMETEAEGVSDGAEDAGLDLSEQEVKTFASPLLQTYQTCEQLSNDLKDAALKEMRTRMAMELENMPEHPFFPGCGGHEDAVMAPPPQSASAPLSGSPSPVEGIDFSGTNNQEKGVDEADIVKTDGRFFYILNRSKLEILRIEDQGELTLVNSLPLESPGDSMLLMNDTVYVLSTDHWQEIKTAPSSGDNPSPERTLYTSVIRVDVVNLSPDRINADFTKSYYYQGDFVAARKIGNRIHIASFLFKPAPLNYHPQIPDDFFQKSQEEKSVLWAAAVDYARQQNEANLDEIDFLDLMPTKLTKENNQLIRAPLSERDCAHTFSASDGSSNGFLNLITIAPDEVQADMAMQWVRGNLPIVYASNDQFILASPEHQDWWFYGHAELKDQTTIHRFKLNGDDLPYYADSVRVPGVLHNSFSLSEYQGYLRVATTTGKRRSFQEAPELEENHLFIVGDVAGQLEIISALEGLAPGEKIWSARFSKDKGFLVTFEQVDPLFTLDLSDPKNPKVAGELKVPGVSTYLQDIGDGKLLAIGYGGDMDGLDFQTAVSLFDVTDFSNPRLADSLSFAIQEGLTDDWSRVSSEANHSHLAVNYFAPLGLTAIPLNTQRYVSNPLNRWGGGSYEFITKLVVINTKPGSALSVLGEINHSSFYNARQFDHFGSPEIRRSYFVGDYIYAISPLVITATRLTDMETTGTHELN